MLTVQKQINCRLSPKPLFGVRGVGHALTMAVSENCSFQHVHGTPLHVTQDMMDMFQANGYVIVRSEAAAHIIMKIDNYVL